MEREEIKEVVKEAIAESHSEIGVETHELHHQFIREELERRQKRRQAFSHAKKTAIGAITIATLAGIWHWVEWVGELVIKALRIKVG